MTVGAAMSSLAGAAAAAEPIGAEPSDSGAGRSNMPRRSRIDASLGDSVQRWASHASAVTVAGAEPPTKRPFSPVTIAAQWVTAGPHSVEPDPPPIVKNRPVP